MGTIFSNTLETVAPIKLKKVREKRAAPWYMSVLCRVCHVFPPVVSLFGLFPVLVSCHYELSMFQLCLSRYVLITLCILVLSFEFDLVWSGLLVTSRCILSLSLVLSCLDVIIKDYYLSLRPRLRVLVPPSCVHRDRRPDLTVSGAHSPRFVFRFQKSFVLFLLVCPVARKSPLVLPP